jgi:hypothetical protein
MLPGGVPLAAALYSAADLTVRAAAPQRPVVCDLSENTQAAWR